MSITWADYCTWTHETAMRKVPRGPERVEVGAQAVDDREVAELIEIWALGLGGEFMEMLAELPTTDLGSGLILNRDEAKVECGDVLYYLARMFVDTGNEASAVDMADIEEQFGQATLLDVAKHIGRVVECVKKALRKEGREGIVRLTLLSTTFKSSAPPWLPGRREEIGGLLRLALAAMSGWLEDNHSSLSEICIMNQAKLMARKAAGTIANQGERK